MASRKELLEKYQGQKTTSPKKKKSRGAFGVEFRKLQEKAGVVEAQNTNQKGTVPKDETEITAVTVESTPKVLPSPKRVLEVEAKKKPRNQKSKNEIDDRDGFAISLLGFMNSEKASTVRFLLYLLSEDCPINEKEYYHITQEDAGLDRTSFTYAKLSLKATGSFFEAKVSSAEGGRPRLAYKFDKEQFYSFVLSQKRQGESL